MLIMVYKEYSEEKYKGSSSIDICFKIGIASSLKRQSVSFQNFGELFLHQSFSPTS